MKRSNRPALARGLALAIATLLMIPREARADFPNVTPGSDNYGDVLPTGNDATAPTPAQGSQSPAAGASVNLLTTPCGIPNLTYMQADQSHIPSNLCGGNDFPYKAYIASLVLDILRRQPNAADIEYWRKIKTSDGYYMDPTSVALAFLQNPSWYSLVADSTYRAFLHRPMAQSEKSYWEAAKLSRDETIAAVVTSPEFISFNGNTPLVAMKELYKDLLCRAGPSDAEIGQWNAFLGLGPGALIDPNQTSFIVQQILGAPETLAHDLQNTYVWVLNRQGNPPEPNLAGIQYHYDKRRIYYTAPAGANVGEPYERDLALEFFSSKEYFSKAQKRFDCGSSQTLQANNASGGN